MYKTARRRSGMGKAAWKGPGLVPGVLPQGVVPRNLNLPPTLETMLQEKSTDMMMAQQQANAVSREAADAPSQSECNCLVDNLVAFATEQGVAVDDVGALFTACTASPSEFKQLLHAQGVNLEACKPWYARKKTLMAGGAVLAGIILWRIL